MVRGAIALVLLVELAVWLDALRDGAVGGRGSYRAVVPDAGELARVLADAGSSREVRVAAAVALGAIDPLKLRVAASEIADSVVRRVADAACEERAPDGLEDEIERALEASAQRSAVHARKAT